MPKYHASVLAVHLYIEGRDHLDCCVIIVAELFPSYFNKSSVVLSIHYCFIFIVSGIYLHFVFPLILLDNGRVERTSRNAISTI